MPTSNHLILCKFISTALASISFAVELSNGTSFAGTLSFMNINSPPPFRFLSALMGGM